MDTLINDITKGLAKLDTVDGLSFAGKQLKLENENDAKEVIDAINICKNLQHLNLEGNSLGVNAARAISNALSKHPEFKRAIWKDMFTGRMKNEIPEALRYLGFGLTAANASILELDLSDNAFGPIGMEGLVALLKSSCCYALQELKLNNNGLGITGAKLLSSTLLDCYDKSKERGKPLGLRVFIAGRNRLENEGALALAKVFEKMGTLEELIIPQNGIYHKGIAGICEALKSNKNIRVLNLNDNTVGTKGCFALSLVLPQLKHLTYLNLGDCLTHTKGAVYIAKGLSGNVMELQELIMDFNEIGKDGGIALVTALQNNLKLTTLQMDGNKIGQEGRGIIKSLLAKVDKFRVLVSLEDDESDDDEEEDEEDDDEEEEEGDNDGTESEEEPNFKTDNVLMSPPTQTTISKPVTVMSLLENITAADFLQFPTPERFLALSPNKAEVLITELKVRPEGYYLESLTQAIMNVSSLISCNIGEIRNSALSCSNTLYRELFRWSDATNTPISVVSNCLLVHLGLIKNEDKSWKIPYRQDQCKEALKLAMVEDFFPKDCKEIILFCLNRKPKQPETILVS